MDPCFPDSAQLLLKAVLSMEAGWAVAVLPALSTTGLHGEIES